MLDVTQLLNQMETGDPQVAAALLPAVYEQLRRQAALQIAREAPGQTLTATALVHEAYLRVVGPTDQAKWQNRAHFYAAAGEAMRRVLVDRARARMAQKRGGDLHRVETDLDRIACRLSDQELLDLDRVLDGLSTEDPMAAHVVRLHVLAGESIEMAGELLGLSRATAYRLWAFARAWLRDALQESP